MNVPDFGFRVVGAVGVSMNIGKAPASTGSSYAGLCKRGRSRRFRMSRCEEHCVQRCWHPPCFLEIVTECVTSQPKACYPCLQKLIDTGSWTELVHPSGRISCLYLSTNLLIRGHSCVSSHIVSSANPSCVSDRPRKNHSVCCRFKRRDFCL